MLGVFSITRPFGPNTLLLATLFQRRLNQRLLKLIGWLLSRPALYNVAWAIPSGNLPPYLSSASLLLTGERGRILGYNSISESELIFFRLLSSFLTQLLLSLGYRRLNCLIFSLSLFYYSFHLIALGKLPCLLALVY